MDKDGAYRVVYGTQLKDIIGKVKMVAVGYGREAEDGSQTLEVSFLPSGPMATYSLLALMLSTPLTEWFTALSLKTSQAKSKWWLWVTAEKQKMAVKHWVAEVLMNYSLGVFGRCGVGFQPDVWHLYLALFENLRG
jgi:hypothetical protein